MLTSLISKKTMNNFDRESYNYIAKKDFNSFSAFVQLHYVLTERRDTDFWRYMSSRKVLSEFSAVLNGGHELTFKSEIENKMSHKSLHLDRLCGFHCIAVGNNWSPVTPLVLRQWNHTHPSKNFKDIADTFKSRSEKSIAKWEKIIANSPLHYDYLKKKFHDEDTNEV